MVFIMDKVITALKQQKNNPDRINVYIDDQFAFGVSRFVGAWLRTGQVIEESRIEQLLNKDTYEQTLQKVLKFIAYQSRTETEVRKKMAKLGCKEELIENIIHDLKEKNYINDADFAKEWIATRTRSKPRSYRYFAHELKRKGITEEYISLALQNAPDESDMALQLGKKYLKRYANLNHDEFKKKMYGVLARRAFPYEIIKTTIEKLINERNLEGNG